MDASEHIPETKSAEHRAETPVRRNLGPLAQGVKPGVSLAAGVACEFTLAFLLNLVIFIAIGEQLSANRDF